LQEVIVIGCVNGFVVVSCDVAVIFAVVSSVAVAFVGSKLDCSVVTVEKHL
jgi:hypothetical protein